MTPEEFATNEDHKAINRIKYKLVKAVDGEEVILVMTSLLSMLIFMTENHSPEPIKLYKKTINALLESAKEFKEKNK